MLSILIPCSELGFVRKDIGSASTRPNQRRVCRVARAGLKFVQDTIGGSGGRDKDNTVPQTRYDWLFPMARSTVLLLPRRNIRNDQDIATPITNHRPLAF